MTKFYVRNNELVRFDSYSYAGIGYQTSFFDCRYLEWCYIMTPRYQQSFSFFTQSFGSAENNTKFKVNPTGGVSNRFGFLTGFRNVEQPIQTPTFIGDPNRTIIVKTSGPIFGSPEYFIRSTLSDWTTAGYADFTIEPDFFKFQLCTQIKQAKNLGFDSGYEEWNVIYGQNFSIVLYYPGNDPQANEVIEIA